MTPKIKVVSSTAVSTKREVVIPIDTVQAAELRNALAVVEKYKKSALAAFRKEVKYSPKESDWCMISYCVKSDKVIVSITDGMAG